MRYRRIAVVLAATLATTAACGFGSASERDVAADFVAALSEGDVSAAAASTDDPGAAAAIIGQVFEGLGQPSLTAEVEQVTEGERAGFRYRLDWDLGNGRYWSATTTAQLARDSGRWLVHWEPSLLHPELGRGEGLELRGVRATGARVVDHEGRPLMRWQAVTVVRVDPARTADLTGTLDELAPMLAQIDPGITGASLRADAPADGSAFTVISLREADAARVEGGLSGVPGVELSQQGRLLTERGISSPALGEIEQVWLDHAEAHSGWQVAVVDGAGRFLRTLAGSEPAEVPDLQLTLDLETQLGAQAAVGELDDPAAVVAVRSSTGEIVAVAQNRAADAEGPIALTGLYPPGSTFKVATAAAALERGTVTPDTLLPCPGTENVEGRQIPNDDGFDLGVVPLRTAFAHSCNTTFARLGVDLPPEALVDAAGRFGLGSDWVVPGMSTVTGRVPPAESAAEQVEASIGQGRVVASPFGMALVAATVVHGSTPAPTLVVGRPATTTAPPEPPAPQIRDDLAEMMRATVTEGSAMQLADLPGVIGKTGTAQYGDGTRSHGWFIGAQDDLAFAVLATDAGSSGPAVAAAGRLLRGLPGGRS